MSALKAVETVTRSYEVHLNLKLLINNCGEASEKFSKSSTLFIKAISLFMARSAPLHSKFNTPRASTLDRCSLSQVIVKLCLQHHSVARVN